MSHRGGSTPTDALVATHDRWDSTLPPVLTVESGSEATFVATGSGHRFTSRHAMTAAAAAGGDADRQALTGPVAVRGARPGDALRVEVLDVEPDRWGTTSVGPGLGLLPGRLADELRVDWDLSDGRLARPVEPRLAELGIAIPMRPFPGVIGVAPAGRPRGTRAPARSGGNLDVRGLVAGSSLWLPIEVDDALVSIGDLHAAQGSGEVGGTAIETTGVVRARLSVEAGRARPPRYTSPDVGPAADGPALCATGIGPDLMAAAREAVGGLVSDVAERIGASEAHAMVLLSVAADLRIEELVDDPAWVVSCCLSLALLGGAGDGAAT